MAFTADLFAAAQKIRQRTLSQPTVTSPTEVATAGVTKSPGTSDVGTVLTTYPMESPVSGYSTAFNPTAPQPLSMPVSGGGGGFDLGGTLGGIITSAGDALIDKYIVGDSGASEPQQGTSPVPGNFSPGANTGGGCELPAIRVGNQCVDPTAALPGGRPLVAPASGSWQAVYGRYGAGVTPQARQTVTRVCPPGFKVGKDGICYERLSRRERMWDPGTKPLLTGGEMAAIAKAKRAAGRLARTQKSIKKTARALEKAC